MNESRAEGDGLYVIGLPTWSLQFQIALSALNIGDSTRAMAAMENSFLCYETWLPRYVAFPAKGEMLLLTK